ncbi:VCBS repeat [Methylophilaceae bacterium]
MAQTTPIQAVATVAKVDGLAIVRHVNGTQEAIKAGAKLAVGDVVVTAAGVTAKIQLAAGGSVDCGGENPDAITIDKTVLDFFADAQDTKVADAKTTDSAFENINLGNNNNPVDLNAELEATAAGGDFGDTTAGNTYVTLNSINTTTQPTTFSNTNTFTAPTTTSAPTPLALLITDPLTTPVDSPSVLIADTTTVSEDNPATGNVLDNDSDADNALSVLSFTVAGVSGTFTAGATVQTIPGVGTITIGTDGAYTFTPNADYNGTVPTITYTTNTGSTSTLDIDVNDVPSFSAGLGSDLGAVTEDITYSTTTDLRTTGKLTVTDADGTAQSAIDTVITPVASNGALGSLSINAAGEWIYTVDNSLVQYLDAAETKQEVFTVKSVDGTSHDITITITGTNDVPSFSAGLGSDLGAVTEDITYSTTTDLRTTGKLTVTDADGTAQSAIDTVITPVASNGALGSLSINAAGEWIYTVDNSLVQYLDAAETKQEVFTVKSVDGTSHDITITITGTDDVPVFSNEDGEYTFSYQENRATSDVIGTVTATDLDSVVSYYISENIQDASGNDIYEINSSTGAITLTAAGYSSFANNFEVAGNSRVITVIASDGLNETSIKVNLNETNQNEDSDGFITVTDVTVYEETDEYAEFTVTIASGGSGSDSLKLSLEDATARGFGVNYGSDSSNLNLEYSIDGTNWFAYNANQNQISPDPLSSKTIFVRTPIVNDWIANSGQTFNLKAWLASDPSKIATGEATILDSTANDNFGLGNTTDNETKFILKLVAVGADTIYENVLDRNRATYKVVAYSYDETRPGNVGVELTGADIPEGTVIVSMAKEGDLASWSSDYSAPMNQVVRVGQEFYATAIDDLIVDNNESFTVTLVDGSYSGQIVVSGQVVDKPMYEGIAYHDATVETKIVSDDLAAVPKAYDLNKSVVEESSVPLGSSNTVNVNSNVMLIIDVSGSMKTVDSGTGATRLALAKVGAKALLDKYDDYGDVMVQVVKFDSNASVANGGTWMTISAAKTYIDSLAAGSYTNYDRALDTAMTVDFGTAKGAQAGALNVSYFFSDGNPTEDSAGKRNTSFTTDPTSAAFQSQDIGIQTGEEWAWKQYLEANNVISYAYKIGAANVNLGYLDPIAYNVGTSGDIDAAVADLATLAQSVLIPEAQLQPKVVDIPPGIVGNIILDSGSNFGPDGASPTAQLMEVVYNGTTYTFSANDSETPDISLDVDLGNNNSANLGTLKIKGDGSYSFTPSTFNVGQAGLSATLEYTIQDSTGDKATANFIIEITDKGVPIAYDDTATATVGSGGSGSTTSTLINAVTLTDTSAGNSLSSGATISSSFNVATGQAGSIAFTVTFGGSGQGPSDYFKWELQRDSGNGSWATDQSDTGLGGNAGATYTRSISITSPGTYRIYMENQDGSSGATGRPVDFTSAVSNVVLTLTGTGVAGTNATGNVITNDTQSVEGATVTAVTHARTISKPGAGTYLGYTEIAGDKGTLYIKADGSYVYVPNANAAEGNDTFTYTLSQADGDNDTADLVITVTAPDTTAPTTTVSSVSFSADTGTSDDFITSTAAQTISGTLSAATVTGEVVKVSLDNGRTWQTATNTIGQNSFSLSGVTLTVSNTLQVRVEDAAGNAGTAKTQAYVLDTTAPSITSSATATAIDENVAAGTTVYTVTATDTNTLTYSLSGTDAASFDINSSTGVVTIKASPDFETKSSYAFNVVATDTAGNATSQAVTLAVNNLGENLVDDILIGTAGDDTLSGLSGNDKISGGAGNDTITGGDGNDTITGGAGNDAITGGAGNDTIVVNAVVGTSSDSSRVTVSGNNNDTGADTITGFDLSNDTLKIVATNITSFVHATDTAIGTATGNVNDGTVGSFLTTTGLIELNQTPNNNNWGDSGDIALTFTSPTGTWNKANFEARIQYDLTGTASADTITTGALNDTISGGAGNDTITGGAGNDTITGGAGNDAITGGAGNDTIVVNAVVGTSSDSSRVTVSGNNNDTGADTITGFDLSNDTLKIVATNITSFVHATDTAIGTATGNVNDGTVGSFLTTTGLIELNQTPNNNNWGDSGDIALTFTSPTGTWNEANFEARIQYDLTGTASADTITTGALNDTISGGAGNDTITGGAGSDKITGGTGDDKFTFASADSTPTVSGSGDAGTLVGHDIITDFSLGNNDTFNTVGTAAILSAGNTDGTNSTLTIGGVVISSHTISATGMITFQDANSSSDLTLSSSSHLAAAVEYLQANDIGGIGSTVAFTAMSNTYVYTQTAAGASGNTGGLLVCLEGVSATGLTTNLADTTAGYLHIE